jgi:hypothetical protein
VHRVVYCEWYETAMIFAKSITPSNAWAAWIHVLTCSRNCSPYAVPKYPPYTPFDPMNGDERSLTVTRR